MESQVPTDESHRRAEAIAWVRAQIDCYSLTLEELQKAGCFDVPKPVEHVVRYRNAEGQTWDGKGEMPHWLQRAINAGQSVGHFLINA